MSKRSLHFEDEGWSDYLYWFTADRKIIKRINRLLEEMRRTPYAGIGKPEALKADYSGFWARRITDTDRLIYKATDTEIIVIACRRHYDDK